MNTQDPLKFEDDFNSGADAVPATPEQLQQFAVDGTVDPLILAAIDCRTNLRKRVQELRTPGVTQTLTILHRNLLPGFPYDDPQVMLWQLNQFLKGSGMRFKPATLHNNRAWKLCRE